jgi:thioesterase domain-containing protein/acyl carrier protein
MLDCGELESSLIRIWESVLEKRGIGIRDSFWDLGGQSLTALRLMRRIEKQFGKTLPLTTLLHVPTIEEMAELLRQTGCSPAWSSLVALQPRGSKPPFFCVHALGGLVVGFRHLARHLGAEQPVYGLQAQGMEGKTPILTRVEDMAARYLQEIRAVHPHGPYYLGGLCFGGWVAYEMAQQLRAQSEEVGLLAMFDSYTENSSRRSVVIKLLRHPSREGLAFLRQRVGLHPREVKANIQRRFLPRSVKQVRKALRAASNSYVPRPYPGRITCFTPTRKSVLSSGDPGAAWEKLAAGGVDIQSVPGHHENLLAEPQVMVVAQRLSICLERAREEHLEVLRPEATETSLRWT